jgi:Ni,Fe-hydrogenase III large subunit
LPAGPIHLDPRDRLDPQAPRPSAIAGALVEGWRGEIAHVALTGARGEIRRYKVVDPSFHDWFGLAIALRGNADPKIVIAVGACAISGASSGDRPR